MTPTARYSLMLALTGLLISAVGCTGDRDQQIRELQNEVQVKIATINDRERELFDARQNNARLQTELSEKDADLAVVMMELDAAHAELADLRAGAREEPVDLAAGWERIAVGDRIPLSSDVLFSPGSATLSDGGKAALDAVIGDLLTTYSGLPVRVYGHTDTDPIQRSAELWTDNLDLSANRAMAVTRYLIDKGVAADNVETIAMGATHPVATNSTTAGKAQNRRVEIVVIR